MVLPGNKEPTYGERLVRVGFNPSESEQVDRLKRDFAALIDRVAEVKANPQGKPSSIHPVEYAMHQGWKSQAIHYLDLACMLAVKAATVQVEPMDPSDLPDFMRRD